MYTVTAKIGDTPACLICCSRSLSWAVSVVSTLRHSTMRDNATPKSARGLTQIANNIVFTGWPNSVPQTNYVIYLSRAVSDCQSDQLSNIPFVRGKEKTRTSKHKKDQDSSR